MTPVSPTTHCSSSTAGSQLTASPVTEYWHDGCESPHLASYLPTLTTLLLVTNYSPTTDALVIISINGRTVSCPGYDQFMWYLSSANINLLKKISHTNSHHFLKQLAHQTWLDLVSGFRGMLKSRTVNSLASKSVPFQNNLSVKSFVNYSTAVGHHVLPGRSGSCPLSWICWGIIMGRSSAYQLTVHWQFLLL